MGVSTNGQICFGILLEEGATMPWDEHDIGDWWRDQRGYVPIKQLYDDDGEHLPGVTKQDISAHYSYQREFDAAHLCPITLVNVCSDSSPHYILAIPSTIKVANRGYPIEIDKNVDFVLDPEQLQVLRDFVSKHGITHEDEPQWYLSGYWGS